jgi:hypothetical protein
MDFALILRKIIEKKGEASIHQNTATFFPSDLAFWISG